MKVSLIAFVGMFCLCGFVGSAQAQQNTTPATIDCSGDASAAAASSNPYAGMDVTDTVIFDHPQLLFAQQIMITNDGRISAPNLTPCPDAPWKDPALFYAAWLFCDSSIPSIPDPSRGLSNPKATIALLQALERYNTYMRVARPLHDACIAEVLRRTAYPSNLPSNAVQNTGLTASSNAGSGNVKNEPYTTQNLNCHAIKDAPSQALAAAASAAASSSSNMTTTQGANHSLDINHTGDNEVDGALVDCDTYGLSLEAQEYAKVHICDDRTAWAVIAGHRIGDEAQAAALAECNRDKQAYEADIRHRRDAFEQHLGEFRRFQADFNKSSQSSQ